MIELPKMPRPRKQPANVFIRFGRWSARSQNHHTGEDEIGVSVCPARMNDDGTVSLLLADCDPIWWEQMNGQGRLTFPVTGTVIGYGSDDEPLLRQVRALPYAVDFGSIPWQAKNHKCLMCDQIINSTEGSVCHAHSGSGIA
jgi:hypothetical protein